MEKNKAKNGFKSSPFEFNKRRADFFGETGKNKKNIERKTRKFNPNTTVYAQRLQVDKSGGFSLHRLLKHGLGYLRRISLHRLLKPWRRSSFAFICCYFSASRII
ncbi:hypothetical protein Bca52824_026847 [Brassica carinata]|uniref:Uncharacterized protein n=1 Tax=Brassica carinata TaxID=52824 RepID=A0A8X7SHE1_BRACI|nr:hypothetical protein Bca52824_026847 [Brassica carinata]